MLKKHILLIDDDPAILTGLQQLLLQAEYDVSVASDGKQALNLLVNNPDLVVLDLMLPDTDGFALCRHIRELGRYIPLLILSARDELNDKVLGLELQQFA